MKELRLGILVWLITLSCTPKNDSLTTVFPAIDGWVNDFENVLDEDNEMTLNDFLAEYEKSTTRSIVVLTVDQITPYEDIQEYATDLGNHFGVGDKEANNGLVIVLSAHERSVGIATGLGTEKILTDQICKDTIDNIMIPYFKNEEYYLGLLGGIHHLMNKWDGSDRTKSM